MLYASVNRGAKGGGWSAPSNGVTQTTIDNLQYTQEILTSYELGEKLTFWDGRARLNGAVFYYDYQDYKGFFLAGLTQVVQSSYALTNARFTYSNEGGHWELSGWVKNLADKQYRVYNLDLSALGFDQGVYGPPRTYGATFNYRWGK